MYCFFEDARMGESDDQASFTTDVFAAMNTKGRREILERHMNDAQKKRFFFHLRFGFDLFKKKERGVKACTPA